MASSTLREKEGSVSFALKRRGLTSSAKPRAPDRDGPVAIEVLFLIPQRR